MKDQVVAAGTWVQIRQQVLAAGQRAPQVPKDTAATPLVLLVKGFLVAESSTGQEAEVITLSGRKMKGELAQVMPGYTHDFGQPVPELMHVGHQAREMLEGGDSDD